MTRSDERQAREQRAVELAQREEAVDLAWSLLRCQRMMQEAMRATPATARRVYLTGLRFVEVRLRALPPHVAKVYVPAGWLLSILELATPRTCCPDAAFPDWSVLDAFRLTLAEMIVRQADRPIDELLAHPAPELRIAAIAAMGAQPSVPPVPPRPRRRSARS